jgi:hypothetical protein
MTVALNTIVERAQYQAAERALLAELEVDLPEEAPCRECGCSDSLACPQGCGWAQPDLCTVCAAELDELGCPITIVATASASASNGASAGGGV